MSKTVGTGNGHVPRQPSEGRLIGRFSFALSEGSDLVLESRGQGRMSRQIATGSSGVPRQPSEGRLQCRFLSNQSGGSD